MKRGFIALMGAAFLGLAGCDNNNGHSGGPGATRSSEPSHVFGQKEDTFSLSVPTLSTRIKQGEAKTISIAINRGKNFEQDVKLAFAGLPDGLTVEPSSHSIQSMDKDVKVNLKAADKAALGDFTIKVTGTPAHGASAESDLKVSIAKK
jgi:uncharacterized membrane protein